MRPLRALPFFNLSVAQWRQVRKASVGTRISRTSQEAPGPPVTTTSARRYMLPTSVRYLGGSMLCLCSASVRHLGGSMPCVRCLSVHLVSACVCVCLRSSSWAPCEVLAASASERACAMASLPAPRAKPASGPACRPLRAAAWLALAPTCQQATGR